MTFGSLFAGIGGFDLGFERAGLTCNWQVEIDPFCRKVLAKHWPDVRRHDDVRTFPPDDGTDWRVDVICGGFPCQDISVAGRGDGIDGERSGLWREYARIVRVVRPRFVVVENVSALLTRGLDRVLGELAACGYDAEWDCIPAAALGAPHRRDRVFIFAHADRERREEQHLPALAARAGKSDRSCDAEPGVSDAQGVGRGPGRAGRTTGAGARQEDAAELDDPASDATQGDDRPEPEAAGEGRVPFFGIGRGRVRGQWPAEPGVGRVADGVSGGVDRLKGLGNAVVPQVAEFIGRRLMAMVTERT